MSSGCESRTDYQFKERKSMLWKDHPLGKFVDDKVAEFKYGVTAVIFGHISNHDANLLLLRETWKGKVFWFGVVNDEKAADTPDNYTYIYFIEIVEDKEKTENLFRYFKGDYMRIYNGIEAYASFSKEKPE
jgi:hypothetical protein